VLAAAGFDKLAMSNVPACTLRPSPFQSMYLVLVTNKSSNILEDLETLRMCGKVIPEYVDALEEEEVRPGIGAPSLLLLVV
jgi:hypothetical protein